MIYQNKVKRKKERNTGKLRQVNKRQKQGEEKVTKRNE
jgi:hypothetical protein